MNSAVSLVLVFHYLNDVADCVGEADVMVITSVMPPSSWTWCSPLQTKTLLYLILS